MEPLEQANLDQTATSHETPRFPIGQIRFYLTLIMIGFLIFILGIDPGLFGLDRGVSIGFVQIIVLLIGLAIMTWAANLTLQSFWPKGQKSLLADFGTRTIATGYVICVFTALADAFGLGTNPMPNVFLGLLQSRGVMIGMSVILLGLLMAVRWKFPETEKKGHTVAKPKTLR